MKNICQFGKLKQLLVHNNQERIKGHLKESMIKGKHLRRLSLRSGRES